MNSVLYLLKLMYFKRNMLYVPPTNVNLGSLATIKILKTQVSKLKTFTCGPPEIILHQGWDYSEMNEH